MLSARVRTPSYRGADTGQGPGAGGLGHCLFEGRYPLPNYRPCFLALSGPQFSLTAPYFLGSQTTAPEKIGLPQYKITYKTDPNSFSKLSIQWIPCISQNRVNTNTSYKLLPLLGSQFEVDRPLFWPSKRLTAPRFCRSPPPLCTAVWQWVVIQYLSAPLPQGGGGQGPGRGLLEENRPKSELLGAARSYSEQQALPWDGQKAAACGGEGIDVSGRYGVEIEPTPTPGWDR